MPPRPLRHKGDLVSISQLEDPHRQRDGRGSEGREGAEREGGEEKA